MQKFDVLIVGAGMVGLTLALAIRKQSALKIALVDTTPITPLSDEPEVRVSAINAASENIFKNLEVWPLIQAQRLQSYQQMHVWDKAGFGQLNFDQSDIEPLLNAGHLGHIIENNVIRNALWQKAQADDGIHFYQQHKISNIGFGDSEAFISFAAYHQNASEDDFGFTSASAYSSSSSRNVQPISAKLIVGVDGANSWVRKQIHMPMTYRDYDHHAIVATVECEQGHQNTAWQVFLPEGPLAFLPLFSDENQPDKKGKMCSIVWSTSPKEAKRLKELSPQDFAKALSAASDGKLGVISLVSERYTHPLSMRLVHDFVKDRVVLIGDAAHTIHPLAGQGVNLGLLDAAALSQTISQTLVDVFSTDAQTGAQYLSANHPALKAFSRWRKAQAAELVVAMELIKQLFSIQQKTPKFLRGMGMSIVDQMPLIKKQLIKHALGHAGHLPSLAQKAPKL